MLIKIVVLLPALLLSHASLTQEKDIYLSPIKLALGINVLTKSNQDLQEAAIAGMADKTAFNLPIQRLDSKAKKDVKSLVPKVAEQLRQTLASGATKADELQATDKFKTLLACLLLRLKVGEEFDGDRKFLLFKFGGFHDALQRLVEDLVTIQLSSSNLAKHILEPFKNNPQLEMAIRPFQEHLINLIDIKGKEFINSNIDIAKYFKEEGGKITEVINTAELRAVEEELVRSPILLSDSFGQIVSMLNSHPFLHRKVYEAILFRSHYLFADTYHHQLLRGLRTWKDSYYPDRQRNQDIVKLQRLVSSIFGNIPDNLKNYFDYVLNAKPTPRPVAAVNQKN